MSQVDSLYTDVHRTFLLKITVPLKLKAIVLSRYVICSILYIGFYETNERNWSTFLFVWSL